MSKLNFAMFMSGATIGSAATWLYLKKYYENIAQEEIDSVKAVFSERKSDFNIKDTEVDERNEDQREAAISNLKPDLVEYAVKLQREGYTNYAEHSQKNTAEETNEPKSDKPYVISPEEFGILDDYTQIELTYYSDGILADDEYEIVGDIDDTVGKDFTDHFGEYEYNAVFVRNDRLGCYYEICKDNHTFREVAGKFR